MKSLFIVILGLICAQSIFAQDSTQTQKNFQLSGYIEAFYNYDFNKPDNHTIPGFMYNFNRANEVNLNLAFIKASYTSDRVRANVALATGSYMNANYALETGVMKNVFEANVGIKMARNSNLWLDAGVMPSHLGFESAIGKDNWTMTRSLVAENSPYFETGVKLGYTSKNEKWYMAALYLNGWQRIQRPDGNSTPAFGTQITYKPLERVTLNYSTFLGNDKADSLKRMRHYHNIYGIFQFTERLGITAGFDIGYEQKNKGSNSYHTWYVPVLIARYRPSEKIRFAARTEYFSDKSGVIIQSGTPNRFKTTGYSVNFDYLPVANVIWRIEARTLRSKDPIFSKDEILKNQNYFLSTSLSLSF